MGKKVEPEYVAVVNLNDDDKLSNKMNKAKAFLGKAFDGYEIASAYNDKAHAIGDIYIEDKEITLFDTINFEKAVALADYVAIKSLKNGNVLLKFAFGYIKKELPDVSEKNKICPDLYKNAIKLFGNAKIPLENITADLMSACNKTTKIIEEYPVYYQGMKLYGNDIQFTLDCNNSLILKNGMFQCYKSIIKSYSPIIFSCSSENRLLLTLTSELETNEMANFWGNIASLLEDSEPTLVEGIPDENKFKEFNDAIESLKEITKNQNCKVFYHDICSSRLSKCVRMEAQKIEFSNPKDFIDIVKDAVAISADVLLTDVVQLDFRFDITADANNISDDKKEKAGSQFQNIQNNKANFVSNIKDLLVSASNDSTPVLKDMKILGEDTKIVFENKFEYAIIDKDYLTSFFNMVSQCKSVAFSKAATDTLRIEFVI